MTKGPFEKAPHYRSRMGSDLYHSQRRSSSSQPFQGSQPPWKSKRPFGKSFLKKEGNLSQHNLTSTKNTLSGYRTDASVKVCASFGTKSFSERGNRRLQYFLEN